MFAFDKAVDQSIAFKLDTKFKIFIARRECLEIVGPINVSRSVEVCTMISQRLWHIWKRRRTLKNKVLKQVGHARFAVPFMTRTDEDRHVDGDGRSRRFWEQYNSGPVWKPILRRTFNANHFLWSIFGLQLCGGITA